MSLTGARVKKPSVKFSQTFLHKETLIKTLSIDNQQPLRRRSNSSEGCLLRRRRNTTTEEKSFEISFDNELKNRRSFSPGRAKNYMQNLSNKRGNTTQLIPVEHPYKIVWNVLTVILSIAHSYLTHLSIRDRRFECTPFISFCQAWFLIDILLSFFTERKTSDGVIINDHRRIVARYLTSWFVIDVLSLFPWEVLYVKPLIEVQNKRGFFKKSFFRSRAVVRVTKQLRGKHFQWFGTVAKHSKQHGFSIQRLLRLTIKYVPKYMMFFRNMKAIIAMRLLRFVHCARRSIKNIEKSSDASTRSISTTREDEDNDNILYDWEKIEDDDGGEEDNDGVPL